MLETTTTQIHLFSNLHLFHKIPRLVIANSFPWRSRDSLKVIDTKLDERAKMTRDTSERPIKRNQP